MLESGEGETTMTQEQEIQVRLAVERGYGTVGVAHVERLLAEIDRLRVALAESQALGQIKDSDFAADLLMQKLQDAELRVERAEKLLLSGDSWQIADYFRSEKEKA
jgi:hypothetical protein